MDYESTKQLGLYKSIDDESSDEIYDPSNANNQKTIVLYAI